MVHWFGVVCAPATRAGVYAWRDVPYAGQASAPNPKLTLDVFVPKAPPFPRPLLPVLVFVHGECGSCCFVWLHQQRRSSTALWDECGRFTYKPVRTRDLKEFACSCPRHSGGANAVHRVVAPASLLRPEERAPLALLALLHCAAGFGGE